LFSESVFTVGTDKPGSVRLNGTKNIARIAETVFQTTSRISAHHNINQ
jgi:hypothetical protein